MLEPREKPIHNSNWEITTNRYVAFLDIMGFKDLVARSPHNEIYEMMRKIDEIKRVNENVKWMGGEGSFVKSTFFSDSIMLFSKDDSLVSAVSLINTVSSITSDLLSSSIPHKGALSFGKMTIDNDRSIFFGQPLIDAYLLQEELSLYCIVVHSSAEHEIEKKEFNDLIIHEYICPFKGGSSRHLTIPPLYAVAGSNEDKKFFEEFNQGIKNLRYKTSGHIRRYIDHTEAYLEHLRKMNEE